MSGSQLPSLAEQGQHVIDELLEINDDAMEHLIEQDLRAENLQEIWDNVRSQVSPLNNIITIAGPVFGTLQPTEIKDLLIYYQLYVGCEGFLVRDAAVNRVFLGPQQFLQDLPIIRVAGQIPILMPQNTSAPSPASTSTSPSSPEADEGNVTSPCPKPAKIPRPPNAFIIYRKAHHANVVAQNPGLHNNDISIIIGRMWNGESVAVREDFKAQAETLKQEHLRIHPGYQYKPRRPCEKKKRMSKKKAAAAAAAVLLDHADAATSRAKSMQIVSQYAAHTPPIEELTKKIDGGRQLTLPLPSGLSAEVVNQVLSYTVEPKESASEPVDDPMMQTFTEEDFMCPTIGYGFAPSAEYQTAQANDMSFFPDESDPGFQALVKEVGEAYEAGYYDDLLGRSASIDSGTDNGYVLADYF